MERERSVRLFHKRWLVESIIFGVVVYLIYCAWGIVSGIILTQYYVPDIVNQYPSVEYLEETTTFGAVYEPGLIVTAFGFIVACGSYYLVRMGISRFRRRQG
ncbi:hypothetical protein AB6A23_08540 [Paenibacillus tarimensis]